MKNSKFYATLLLTLTFLNSGCTSTGDTSEVLELVAETKATPQATPAPSAAYEKLMGIFTGLGYEGVGLQYESEAVLEMLIKVFSHPKAAKRQVSFIYTGHAMSFDSGAKALTIGGVKDPTTVLTFIQKNIPLNR